MEYITLENSELKVSRFCMGGCPMGGYGWGQVNERDLIEAVRAALDHGVTFFDTADTYGLGQSELTLAKGLGAQRHQVAIESKFGVRAGKGATTYDNSPTYIRQALEGSLKRLNTDYIDVYVMHYRDHVTPIEDVVDALQRLQQQGKIRYFGLSNISESQMDELLPYRGMFACCQNEFSLACRKHEQALRQMQQRMLVTPMTWGSLGQGILTGKYDREVVFESNDRRSRDIYVNFHGEKLLKNLEIVEVMRDIAAKHGRTVSAVAIRYILDALPGSVVLCGAKRPGQILDNLQGMDWQLDADDLMLLNEISK